MQFKSSFSIYVKPHRRVPEKHPKLKVEQVCPGNLLKMLVDH